MGVLKYKDYVAELEYSAESNVFHGKIFGIKDVVTFEGESVEELKEAFAEAVEDYLEICRDLGKEPEKAYKGSFNVRVKPETHRAAAYHATERGQSLNQYVEDAIESFIVREPGAIYGKPSDGDKKKSAE
ncbi:type II toxin-antitoxin system HicB family antitoxin [Persicobacter diffluens]|uniref:DNA repair protein HhH-GPD n=1 Tax=Persicobacter diffluens TaxID=981 RepID=A0AAN4VVN8_9BACT|nr:DNA repair protein HhH-GPD [Persicobacter diffluens]